MYLRNWAACRPKATVLFRPAAKKVPAPRKGSVHEARLHEFHHPLRYLQQFSKVIANRRVAVVPAKQHLPAPTVPPRMNRKSLWSLWAASAFWKRLRHAKQMFGAL